VFITSKTVSASPAEYKTPVQGRRCMLFRKIANKVFFLKGEKKKMVVEMEDRNGV
jgi:hypothetical protein